MDPVQLATAAVAVLAPFLSTLAGKAGEKVTESLAARAGAGAGGAVDGLYKAIRDEFAAKGDEDARQSLKSLEAKPDSQGRQTALAEVVADKAKADPAFAAQVAELVQRARHDPATSQFLTQVYGNARVRNIANIGRAGNLTIR